MEEQDQVIEGLVKLSGAMLNEIEKLKEDNVSLRTRIEQLEGTVQKLLSLQKDTIETIQKNQHEVIMMGKTMQRGLSNIPYELGMGEVPAPKVASVEETVSKIVNEHAGIARFGDGEFSIMMGNSRQGFQKQDDRLAQRLREVIESNDPNFMIAIADNYGVLKQYSDLSQNEIRYYMTEEVRMGHNIFLDPERCYYNAYMTTPYMLYADRQTEGPARRFSALKKIWEDRNLIIIEGELSRLGVGNDLFAATKSIKRILGPAEHAYDKYDSILSAAVAEGKNVSEPLFIIALGPTATVLAYDLHKAGFQAVDMGHIDNDYEYFLRKADDRFAIPGKYVNNITQKDDVAQVNDEDYLAQIVKKIL